MVFYKFDNFYFYSLQLTKTRLFYLSKKFSPQFTTEVFKNPIIAVSLKTSVKWSQRNIYFVWDFLRTAFYFQIYFLKNPTVSLYNKKYLSLEIHFRSDQVNFKNFLSYVSHFKTLHPKLMTKNYLTKKNHYILNFHESQFQLPLPKGTVFDFYNWKTKVPIIFYPFSSYGRNSKFQNYFKRLCYVQLYKQLFYYKNLKILAFDVCDICTHVLLNILNIPHHFKKGSCYHLLILNFCKLRKNAPFLTV